jgi:integrase
MSAEKFTSITNRLTTTTIMAHHNNDWKACNRQNRFGGSNPPHSAQNRHVSDDFAKDDQSIIKRKKVALRGSKTAKQAQTMRKVRVSLYFGRSFNKDGTAPLYICVNHASSSCYIPLQGVRLKRNQWDKVKKKVINHPQADTINSVALSTLGKANEAIMQLGNVRGLTTAKVRDLIADNIYPSEDVDTGFMAVLQAYMSNCDKPNTADKFSQTQKHIKQWLGAKGARQLQFNDVDVDWLAAFDKYLVAYCPSVNSRSIHLRNIRTIFNYALNHQLTTAPYPFRQYKIKSAPSNPTPLTLEQLQFLWSHHPASDAQAYALDIWKIVFCLIGINMADLCALRTISQGRINYTRQKTQRLYSIKVENVAKTLIQAHRGKKMLLDILEHYKDVHVATSMINRHMKDIASEVGLPPITTYTARYTWATLALSLDTPIEVISQALGHSYGQAVTLGYIMPDRRKVDEANKKVLALLFGNSKDK